MELLRWILLLVGIVFIVLVYLFGRKRRQRKQQQETEPDNDLPEFSARDWDDFDEGVGPVRVITGAGPDGDVLLSDSIANATAPGSTNADSTIEGSSANAGAHPDIIILFILPKMQTKFSGSQINSSVQAMGLKFGEMNIYHYYKIENNRQRTVFSLANMIEPGSFNPDTIHDMQSPGLTVFMQINPSDDVDAMDDLTEMLQRSYQLAGLLEGRICNHLRQPLTEQDAENYRKQVQLIRA